METIPVVTLVVLALATATMARNEALMINDFLKADRALTCESMRTPIARKCSAKFGYSMTRMPNFVNHNDQRAASLHLEGFQRLLDSQCSQELAFLLCSYIFPPCSAMQSNLIVTPCRGLCQRVRDNCSQTLESHGLTWPQQFRCERLQTAWTVETTDMGFVGCANSQPANTMNSSAVTFASQPLCPSRTCKAVPLNKKTFKKRKFDFAIEAEYTESSIVDGQKVLQVRVISPLHFCGTAPEGVVVNATVLIHTDAADLCSCPELEQRRSYLFTGYQVAGRLQLSTRRSLAMEVTRRKQRRRATKYMKKFCRTESIAA